MTTPPLGSSIPELCEAALRASRDAVVLVSTSGADEGGEVLWGNTAFAELTGYPPEEYTGAPAHWLSRLTSDATIADRIRNAVRENQPWNGEGLLRHRTGRLIPVQVHLTPLRSGSGSEHSIAFLGQIRNVEDQKQMEERLWLAQRLGAVAQLARGIARSHEHTVHGLSAYASRCGTPDDPALRALQDAGSSTLRFLRQVEALAVPSPHRVASVQWNHVVRDLEGLITCVLGDHTHLVLDLDPGLGLVRGDQVLLQQILLNLVLNASQAMPEGGVLTITTTNSYPAELPSAILGRRGAGAQVVLSVSDTGRGMPPEIRTRLFEPFFSTRNSSLGLGLTVVQGIVKAGGGYVWIQSSESEGTTARVYLPFVASSLPEGDDPAAG